MRKFWIALLALGFVVAFSMPAFAAVDGKFSGSLRVRGWYNNNVKSLDKDKAAGAGSQQFYDNRLRMQPEFKIAEGLTLTTRFDALEKKWGQTLTQDSGAASTGVAHIHQVPAFNDSLSFERAYVTFDTKGGRFMVGYQEDRAFGTVFGNSAGSKPMIKYFLPLGDFTLIAAIEKGYEDTANVRVAIDSDVDIYDLGFVYKFKGGDAGLMIQNYRDNRTRLGAGDTTRGKVATDDPYRRNIYIFDPYVKMKMGSVYFEAEGVYATGKWAEYEDPKTASGASDIDFEQHAIYLMANVDLAPMYVGGQFLYSSGDDGSDATKKKSGLGALLSLNQAVNMSLMLMSYEYTNQVGARSGDGSITTANRVGYYGDNLWLWQVFAGIKPLKELDIKAAITYAYADKKPKVGAVEYTSDKIGTEFDLTATYKIYDNLSYMVGFGYLWVGDYFKGTNAAAVTENDYLVMHQLLLSF